MFKRKYSVTILDEKWNKLVLNYKFSHIPRQDELIFLDSNGKYYKVINVVHYVTKKHGIFIIVKEFEYEFQLISK
jgi:hypothetical protein